MDNIKKRDAHMRLNTVLIYGFFFAYVLSFVFEGRVYYQVVSTFSYDFSIQHLIAILCHMLGLITAGIVVRSVKKAGRIMKLAMVICAIATGTFLIPNVYVGNISITIAAYMSGMAVACWGSFLKEWITLKERLKSLADALIIANVLMIISGLIATYVSSIGAVVLVILYIAISYGFIYKSGDAREEQISTYNEKDDVIETASSSVQKATMRVAWCVFFFFVVIVTIDSGLMYGVVNMNFQSLDWLVSWYWAAPYILALFLMRIVAKKSTTIYLYIAIGMLAFGFIFYRICDFSASSYLLVDSLLLGASGVLDLFWCSIVGETMEYSNRPTGILSIGWAGNVCGVLIGGMISEKILNLNLTKSDIVIVALFFICMSLMLIPEMNYKLRMLLHNNLYLSAFIESNPTERKEITRKASVKEMLTEREAEILEQVLLGKPNKQIAEELHISENTVKTHMRNILGKYEVTNRTQLISLVLHNIDK